MIILATRLGPHTGEGIILLTLAAPITAFFLWRNCRPLIRVGLALTSHAVAFAIAIELGVRRRDMMVHDIVEMLRFYPPSFTEDALDALLLYIFISIFFLLPALCAALMICCPIITRKYLHWGALLVALLFLSIFVVEAIRLEDMRSFFEGLALAVAFGVAGLLMRHSPLRIGAEPGTGGNAF